MGWQEWAALPDEDRAELVDGRLEGGAAPSWVHETVVGWFVEQLRRWARDHGARVAGSGVRYATGPWSGRMPDVSVFLDGRRPPAHGAVELPPDLAIEVVSPAPADVRRDRVEKVVEYAAFGVRWYWIVDPELRTFEVLELRDGQYSHAGAASAGRVAELPGLPGLQLELDELWSEVDAVLREAPTGE